MGAFRSLWSKVRDVTPVQSVCASPEEVCVYYLIKLQKIMSSYLPFYLNQLLPDSTVLKGRTSSRM